MSLNWYSAVQLALERYSARNSTIQIERSRFIQQELPRMVSDTGRYTLNQVLVSATSEDLPDDVLENAVEEGLLILSDVETSNDVALSRVRRGMNALRKKTLSNYRGSCALCDVDDKGLLVASHVARWC